MEPLRLTGNFGETCAMRGWMKYVSLSHISRYWFCTVSNLFLFFILVCWRNFQQAGRSVESSTGTCSQQTNRSFSVQVRLKMCYKRLYPDNSNFLFHMHKASFQWTNFHCLYLSLWPWCDPHGCLGVKKDSYLPSLFLSVCLASPSLSYCFDFVVNHCTIPWPLNTDMAFSLEVGDWRTVQFSAEVKKTQTQMHVQCEEKYDLTLCSNLFVCADMVIDHTYLC